MVSRRRSRVRASYLAGAILFCAAPARAATITLEPVRDNTLFEDQAGARSNGQGVHLFAGRAAGSDLGRTRRALLAFDVAGSVPAGSTIVSATLTMDMTRTVSGAQPMAIHRVLADWGEGGSNALGEEGMGAAAQSGDATWLHRFFATEMLWASAGGDFEAAASATRSVGGVASYTWGPTAEMTADVQGWLDQPDSNFGWILIGNESAQPTAKRFSSSESGATVRPRLQIEFESAGQPTPTDTPTPPETATPSSTATPTSIEHTATPTLATGCAGDCDEDGVVSIDELIRGASLALGRAPLLECETLDANADARVTIDELVRAVGNALRDCAGALVS
jgi:hypothetical protein